jgi:hypothetical protein
MIATRAVRFALSKICKAKKKKKKKKKKREIKDLFSKARDCPVMVER